MRHAFARVQPQLLAAIDRFRGRRQYLAYPIRREREIGSPRSRRQPLSAPAGEIRDNDVVAEVELGLVKDQPSSGAVQTAIERSSDRRVEDAGRARMRHSRPRCRIEVAVE
jgi:hypothetical protein